MEGFMEKVAFGLLWDFLLPFERQMDCGCLWMRDGKMIQ